MITQKRWLKFVPESAVCPCCGKHVSTRRRLKDLHNEWKVLLGGRIPSPPVRQRFYEWCGRSPTEFGAVCYVCWSEFKSGRPFIGA